jgi:hypothetical protein
VKDDFNLDHRGDANDKRDDMRIANNEDQIHGLALESRLS